MTREAPTTQFLEQNDGSSLELSRERLPRGVLLDSNKEFVLPMEGRKYVEQYSNFYLQRLNKLREKVCKVAYNSWNKMIVDGSTVHYSDKVLDLGRKKTSWAVGTIFREMKYKPSILEEISASHFGAPPPPPSKYTDSENDDNIYLEDESGRIRIVGKLVENTLLVTGCIAAIMGQELSSGDFEVLDIRFAEYSPQPPRPQMREQKARYVAIVSGLLIQNDGTDEEYLQPLQEFLSGELGGTDDHDISSSILHLIIAGNSLNINALSSSNSLGDSNNSDAPKRTPHYENDASRVLTEPVQRLDQLVKDIAISIPLSIMPGSLDLANLTLPQQPLHNALFRQTKDLVALDSFESVTNPNYWDFDRVHFLGHSGQPIDDMYKYFPQDDIDRIDLMNQCLRWQTVAPTAPDTLASYPFTTRDPFSIKSTPHVFFSGSQPYFDSRLVQGLDEDGNSIYTRLITIPEFRKTGEIVLVDITSVSFEAFPVKLTRE